VVFDVVAPVQSRPIGVATLVGAALTLVAVLVAALPRRARVR